MTNEKKICPLRMAALMAKRDGCPKPKELYCLGELCAWWEEYNDNSSAFSEIQQGRCAITDICERAARC